MCYLPNKLIARVKTFNHHYDKEMDGENAKTMDREKAKAKTDAKAKVDRTISANQYIAPKLSNPIFH